MLAEFVWHGCRTLFNCNIIQYRLTPWPKESNISFIISFRRTGYNWEYKTSAYIPSKEFFKGVFFVFVVVVLVGWGRLRGVIIGEDSKRVGIDKTV